MIAESFLAALVRNSWQAGFLVFPILGLQRLFRRRFTPQWNAALWMLVVVRLILPFPISSAASLFNLLPRWRHIVSGTVAPRTELKSMPADPLKDKTPALAAVSKSIKGGTPETPSYTTDPGRDAKGLKNPTRVETPITASPPKASLPSFPWTWVALGVWLGGVLTLGGHVVVSSLRLSRRSQNLPVLTDPSLASLLDDCAARMGVRQTLSIVECAALSSPALLGMWRPRLLLPVGFTGRHDQQETRFVMLHELAHLKRCDVPLNWLVTWLQIVHWFNPLVWLAFSRWRADRELACDAMAIEAAGEDQNHAYGRTILHLVESYTPGVPGPGLIGILETRASLRRRVEMIAGFRPGRRWGFWPTSLVAGMALVGLTDAKSPAVELAPNPTVDSRKAVGFAESETRRMMARWSFAGSEQLGKQLVAPVLAGVLSGTNSIAFGERLAARLAGALWHRMGRPEDADVPAELVGLMLDLLRHESTGAIAADGWQVRVRLPDNRAAAWQEGVRIIGSAVPDGIVRISSTNGWLTVAGGKDWNENWLSLKPGAVLAAEADLAKVFNGMPDEWPHIQFDATLEDGRVLTRATADFSRPPLGPLPKWRLPEKMAHGPFAQFTAIRGISPLASRLGWWRDVFNGQTPDQMFFWSQPEIEFRNWIAVPSQDPSGDLERLYFLAGQMFGEGRLRSGRPVMSTNRIAFALLDTFKGLQPVIRRVGQGEGAFLLGSLYAANPSTNRLSPKLREAISGADVVLQDAELTADAVSHWNVLFQLNQMLQQHLPNARNARANAWMFEHQPSLGAAETQVRQVLPTRLTLERRSSLGATGLELVLLTRWLDGTDHALRGSRLPPVPTAFPRPPKP